MEQDTNAQEPSNNSQEAKDIELKEAEAKKKHEEAEKKQREFRANLLKESQFKYDDDSYSFIFDGGLFSFKLPTFMEKTRIKAILSEITADRSGLSISSTLEIIGTGDMDLICAAKVLTHTKVLMVKSPKKFDIENLDNAQSNDFGYLILISENEYLDRKKKASTKEQ